MINHLEKEGAGANTLFQYSPALSMIIAARLSTVSDLDSPCLPAFVYNPGSYRPVSPGKGKANNGLGSGF